MSVLDPHSLPSRTAGLELLASAVLLLDEQLTVHYLNPAAENLFGINAHRQIGKKLQSFLGELPTALQTALTSAQTNSWSYTAQNVAIARAAQTDLHLDCTVSPVQVSQATLLLEFRPIDAQLKVEREERLIAQQQANRELIRNLAHEIKNPLGGIRGSAQLLERELADPQWHEYTQIIIEEVDRLQALMARLLQSHRAMHPAPLNIHEVLERVHRLISAEFGHLTLARDYDVSLPNITADKEQLIQAVLNIARNAAQAMSRQPDAHLTLRTRARRQVTLAKRRYKLALQVQIIDNGPGIPPELHEQIFYPLVSGTQGGSGLGLSIAQSFIEQHQGLIELESSPGHTCFSITLPLNL